MDDYKELIEQLRCEAEIFRDMEGQSGFTYWLVAKRYLGAADAIEQLVKERDAAIADMTLIVHHKFTNGKTAECYTCTHNDEECWEKQECKWEWRGVQE